MPAVDGMTSSGPGSWFTTEDAMRKPVHSKPPVSLGMYTSMYKKEYKWPEESKPPTEEDVKKLRAKEFAVPQEPQAMPYYDKALREGREVKQIEKQEGITLSPSVLQQAHEEQRKHFGSDLPLAEGHAPKPYLTTELTATQADRPERPQAPSGLEKGLSSSQHLQAVGGGPGATGMLLYRQKLDPTWGTYQHFMLEAGQALQDEAQQNKNVALASSVLVKEYFDHDQRSTYSTDFQHQPAAYTGSCIANKNLSHIFTEAERFHQNRWVSEYKDNYSISLQKLNWASQGCTAELGSALKPQGLSSQSEVAPGTAQ
ncbi:uncharacterized protein LOC116225692 [Phasianus colchicus]|uniref:uncharacterized protein LOC116225692 n=1 Tax=Phasianus colchicus TaxID=9054 RepID=UPI00129ECDA2|nr:uncharacterized protein LOC116225692 [Phasianus colchicus]XP_031444048.1 uncharacterized protein LOC116225692 [Phasianus colchicus]XP_031444049.1 uncharacterized protein LOC116225692 [Phasianus colchicus]